MNTPSDNAHLLDDRQEWLRFSQPLDETAGTPQWSSHVVIDGMHCAACAFNIEAALMSVPGVQSAEVNATTHRARVVWSESAVRPSGWMEAIAAAGYSARPAADNTLRQVREAETRKALWRMAVAGFCMMQVMMYAYPAYVALEGDMAPDVLVWAILC